MKTLIFLFTINLYITSILSTSLINYEEKLNRNFRSISYKLIDEPACSELKVLCSHKQQNFDNDIIEDFNNDLLVLECIQTFLTSQLESLTEDCQHSIWSHTVDLLDDHNVTKIIKNKCNKETENFSDCKQTKQPGHYLGCALDKREKIKTTSCHNILQRLEWVAFSDFRLIGMFVRDCEKNVQQFRCGRLNTDKNVLSQGETVACLQNRLDKLSPECRKGILKVSELQGENIKSDRQLFLLCSSDVLRFCPDQRPGTGQAYKCLIRNRNDPNMSKHCYEQLLRRDKLVASDYKISRSLARACRDDIKNNHCRRGVSEDKDVRLSQILLCLEAVVKNNNTKISNECQIEMTDHRKMLMEDFNLTPEIITGCSDDIEKFCSNLEGHGKTIHCLMEHARPKKKKDRRVTSSCQRALEELIKVSDAGEDWRVDPILKEACNPVVEVACKDINGGDARVMSCLMEKLQTNYMTKDCEQALMQIQYFVARDYKLDPQLYRNCHADAIKLCQAKETWANVNDVQMDPERGPLILPCLHRYAYHDSEQLSPECVQEVRRVMRQRAISVDLIPEVEDVCIDDLSNFCFDKTLKGEEMTCLQDNLEKLTEKCKKAVINYTEDEVGHFELNPVLNVACHSAMLRFCDVILKTGKDEGDMMECLISHKNDPELRQDTKCRATIEHFQLISLKNYHFTHKFKEACRPHVTRFCPKSKTKYDVVACLSEVMRNDVLKSQRHTIPKECRQQVRAQLYQQRENIDFDPKLKSACQNEIQTLCSNVPHDAGQVLECLQTKPNKLGDQCRHAVFQIKKSELTDSGTDYTLINSCKSMIQLFCNTVDQTKVLDCLKTNKDNPQFDSNCHVVVVNRMIQQNLDYRFNPKLQDACQKNIGQHCSHILEEAKNEELNGKMIECLKVKFREGKLTNVCMKEMTEILHEQALNYKLNPLLQVVCKTEIEIVCKSNLDNLEDHGEVEECLKNAFLTNHVLSKECRFEIASLIQESKIDIQVDPILQRACSMDLLRYCSEVERGDGRLLKCLQVILNDQSKALENDCKIKLTQRMKMYRDAAETIQAPQNLEELYSQVVISPARRYFLVVIFTFVGFIFIFGLFCGRVSRRTIASKNK